MIFEIVEVQTYSGGIADERPVFFIYGKEKIIVEEIIDRWYESGPKAGGAVYNYFKVQAGERFYILRHNLRHDAWSLLLS